MRKGDVEFLEMRLEPHGISIDRLTADVSGLLRTITELRTQVKDLERDKESHGVKIDQGLASIRSLLQRANRVAKETGIVDEEPSIDEEPPPVKVARTADQIHADARANYPGRRLL